MTAYFAVLMVLSNSVFLCSCGTHIVLSHAVPIISDKRCYCVQMLLLRANEVQTVSMRANAVLIGVF